MEQFIPWHKRSMDVPPYSLLHELSSTEPDHPPFYCVAAFPWRKNSLDEELWRGAAATNDTIQAEWRKTVEDWADAILVGSSGCFHVHRRLGYGKTLYVKLPKPADWEPERSWNVRCVAWALTRSEPTHPVAIAAVRSILYIVDLFPDQPVVIGRVRGHGDDITSIAIHPSYPCMFLTTSKDGTTRMYDLTYTCRQVPNNPHWPPAPPTQPSFAGPAFGLHASESEGDGLGRCVAVLVGARAGGHDGAVFHAAWHPSADLIATCGMDRCVKIWRVPPVDHAKVERNEEHLVREDRPLFSTDLIHNARVLSITWLSSEILVSHSAPALMRGESLDDMYDVPGTIIVWMWLSFTRYLPDGRVRKEMRGGKSDYDQSESFKVLSEYSLPMSCRVFAFAPILPKRLNPQVLIDDGKYLRIFNLSEFRPRKPPPFPFDAEGKPIEVRSTLPPVAVDETDRELAGGADGMTLEDDEEDEVPVVYKRLPLPAHLTESVPHWIMKKGRNSDAQAEEDSIDRWQVAYGGRLLLGVSEKGTLSIWKLNAP